MKAAVLTVSDGVDMGTRKDASGDLLEGLLVAEGFEVVRRVVPDERNPIAEAIEELADEARVVLTTGGTGVGPRYVTPEATASVLERMVPGIAEAMRADSIGLSVRCEITLDETLGYPRRSKMMPRACSSFIVPRPLTAYLAKMESGTCRAGRGRSRTPIRTKAG